MLFSELLLPPLPFEAEEHKVDWLKFGCLKLLAIRSNRFDRYKFQINIAKNILNPIATVMEIKRINFSLLFFRCL